jgi:hypothetical protein
MLRVLQGAPLTAQELADAIWRAQEGYEPGMREAEAQQRRALAAHAADILVVLAGLGYVELRPRPHRCGRVAV